MMRSSKEDGSSFSHLVAKLDKLGYRVEIMNPQLDLRSDRLGNPWSPQNNAQRIVSKVNSIPTQVVGAMDQDCKKATLSYGVSLESQGILLSSWDVNVTNFIKRGLKSKLPDLSSVHKVSGIAVKTGNHREQVGVDYRLSLERLLLEQSWVALVFKDFYNFNVVSECMRAIPRNNLVDKILILSFKKISPKKMGLYQYNSRTQKWDLIYKEG